MWLLLHFPHRPHPNDENPQADNKVVGPAYVIVERVRDRDHADGCRGPVCRPGVFAVPDHENPQPNMLSEWEDVKLAAIIAIGGTIPPGVAPAAIPRAAAAAAAATQAAAAETSP